MTESTDPGWYPDGWTNPADDPQLTWITHPDDDHPDPVPPDARLAPEPTDVAAERQLHAVHPDLAAQIVAPGVGGIDLSDYSRNPQQKGWGAACSATRATVNLAVARVTVDARIAELVGLIMLANEKQGYSYRAPDTGAYNCRYIGGTTTWSNHAWGLAVDSNWQTNPFTRPLRTDRPRWELDRWNRYGFAWGGDYVPPTACDAMHTEGMGTPEQMYQALLLARTELGPIVHGPVAPPAPTPPAPNPTPWLALPDMVRNSTSQVNQRWQQWYNAFPFVPALLPIISPTDPHFGPQMEAAIRKVQGRYGLAVDGIVGPMTKHLLWTLGWRG